MSTKHTPGPWIAPSGQTNLVCRKSDWDCQQIGALANGFQCIISLKEGESQAEANARLIAAAPELLEILNRVVAISTETYDVDSANACLGHIEQICRRAIAKATGGE